VKRGEETTDEMGITFISLVPEKSTDVTAIRTAMRDHFLGLSTGSTTQPSRLGAIFNRLRGDTADAPPPPPAPAK
jgi:hypothetical protein